jgi:hypothetical protein
MTNRPTRLLRAVFTVLAAGTSIAVIPLSAEGAPGECLFARPKTAAPAGQYWLHLSDWLTNRRCWVLRAKLEPTQAKGAARTGARTAVGTTPARTTEDTAADPLSTRADRPPRPRIRDDGKAALATSAPLGVSDRADRNLSNFASPLDARLPPLGPSAPEASAALSLASEPPATPALAAPIQKTNQHASTEASPESVLAVAEPITEASAFGAPASLQILLLAIFCGPAFYLLAAGTMRRLRPAEAERGPLPYISLDDASANRTLLPPRLESNESSVSS